MKLEWSAFLGALVLSATVQAAQWDERYFNPQPAQDDIVWPLPCDGAVAFRKVGVPVGGPLDDLPIVVGQESEAFSFVEHRRQAHIAGSFTEGAGERSSRYYLVAKYELTALQYQALLTLQDSGAECPKPSRKMMTPATGLSWFEAQHLGHLYNLWLRKEHKNVLPKEDGVSGYVRLPTEVEWEYAARGGVNVDTATFSESRYPMLEGLNEYEWYAGAQSSNGKVQLVGLLKPNPLGLHDMLGNVAEMSQDAFRLNKLHRLHGGSGAYVIRGGDFRQPDEGIRSAARREGLHYDEDGVQKENTVGLRWVVTAPELTSRERIQALGESWKQLGSGEVQSDAAEQGRSAVQELSELAGALEDAKLKEQLLDLEGKLRASNQRQEEARDQAIRASLNLGAFLCTKLRDDGRFLEQINKTNREICGGANAPAQCEGYRLNIERREYELTSTTQYYAATLVDAATLYGEANLAKQVPVLQEMLGQNDKLKGLIPYLTAYWKHQQGYLKTWKIEREAWLSGCMEVR